MLEVSTLNCGVIVQLPPRILVRKGGGIFVHFPAPWCRQPQSCPTKERVCFVWAVGVLHVGARADTSHGRIFPTLSPVWLKKEAGVYPRLTISLWYI